MNGVYLEAIRVHYGDFDELTDCKCIIGKLVAQGLIDFHEKEELMLPTITTAERNQKMLDFVRRKGNSKFDVLVQLLLTKECYKEFAINLHKGTVKNLYQPRPLTHQYNSSANAGYIIDCVKA